MESDAGSDEGEEPSGAGELPASGELDEILAEYVLRKTSSIRVMRPPEVVFAAMQDLQPSDMPVAAFLGRLNAPGRAAAPESSRIPGQGPRSAAFAFADPSERYGWVTLVHEAPRRIVVGLVGKFWRMDLGVRRMDSREEFLQFSDPGYAKIVFEQRLESLRRGTRILAETRIAVTDPASARQFRWYWRAMGIGAHLTIRSLLHGIKRRAKRMP